MLRRIHSIFAGVVVSGLCLVGAVAEGFQLTEPTEGVHYTNVVVAEVPWSIHVVRVRRGDTTYEIQSKHALGGALGLSTLSEQIASHSPLKGIPVGAINGGFYRRDKVYAGAPRGLQVVENELLSGPSGNASFWIDLLGEPHMTTVTPRFEIRWPDGGVTPFELNGERTKDGVELYTPAVGASTRTIGGLELVLERHESSRWLPLRLGRAWPAKVREVRHEGDTRLGSDVMVLSIGPEKMGRYEQVAVGAVLQISTMTSPALTGARTALSGGPQLVRNGKAQKIQSSPDDPYELSSMVEQHPRTAFGWNSQWYFLVQVDGRQNDLSVGMTLEELATCLVKLGCEEALNLDGGGSSSLWFEGKVRNSPCDGYERTIANSLLVVKKAAKGTSNTGRPESVPERSKAGGN
jgi:hypothetical protein